MSLKNRSPVLTLGACKGLLDALVQEGKLATYGYVAAHLGLHPHSTTLWEILGKIVDADAAANRPIRSSLVVNAQSRIPGTAYIERVKLHLPPNFLPDPAAETAYWIGQLYRMGINHHNMTVLTPT